MRQRNDETRDWCAGSSPLSLSANLASTRVSIESMKAIRNSLGSVPCLVATPAKFRATAAVERKQKFDFLTAVAFMKPNRSESHFILIESIQSSQLVVELLRRFR